MIDTESGFLFIDKPKGMTSHDVVDVVRKARGITRVGHAGTLDPLASGLLIVGIGREATKRLGEVLVFPKTYNANIFLGATSTTDDAEGDIMPHDVPMAPRITHLEQVLKQFQGTYEQVPPQYSARKVRGAPAYKHARRGETVQLTSRRVTIHKLVLQQYAYPNLEILVTVSSGTYIRSLARDIGKALKTGGYIIDLRRTAIGSYHVHDATPFKHIRTAPLVPSDIQFQV